MNGIRGSTLILAGLGFAVATVVFGSSMTDAIRVDEAGPVASEPSGMSDPSGNPAGNPSGNVSEPGIFEPSDPGFAFFQEGSSAVVRYDELMQAVGQDPFAPERRPPSQRYRLPGEIVERAPERRSERPDAPNFRLVGSAVIGNAGMALVQVEEAPPVALVVGESLMGYRLASVGPEQAVLVGAAGELTFSVTEGIIERPNNNRNNRNNRESREERARDEAAARAAQIQELLRAGAAGGRANFLFQGRGARGGGRAGRGGRGGGRGGGDDVGGGLAGGGLAGGLSLSPWVP